LDNFNSTNPFLSIIDVENNENFIGLQLEVLELEPMREVATIGGMYILPFVKAPRQ